jgi:iron complex transport system substrate-binding protein
MKIIRNFLPIFLIILMLVTGCSVSSNSDVLEERNEQKEDSKEIIDCLGNKISVPNQINSIACLYSVSGHIVTMLGEGEKIKAVSRGLKRDVVLNMINSKLQDALMPKSGGPVNIEELVKAECDVVFVDKQFTYSGNEVEQLKNFNIPFLAVDFNSIEEEKNAVKMIADVLGKEEIALKYNEYYDSCVNRILEKTKNIPVEERVRVYHSVNEASRTDAKGTLPAEWFEIAGVFNVSVNEDLKVLEDKYFANMEQILMWNPDVILVNEDGVDKYIIENEKWRNINAVKNDRVYKMPNGISRWGHPTSLETPLAILWTAKTLYPELFEDIDLYKETKYFYKEFFKFELDDELTERILIGKGMRISKGETNQ